MEVRYRAGFDRGGFSFLSDLAVAPDGRAWAVGDGLVRVSGEHAVLVDSVPWTSPRLVELDGESNGWVLAQATNTSEALGLIYRLTDGELIKHTDVEGVVWTDLALSETAAGWAVGVRRRPSGGSRLVVYQLTAGSWRPAEVPDDESAHSASIELENDQAAWIVVREGRVWRWDGSMWRFAQRLPGTKGTFDEIPRAEVNDIASEGAGRLWAVGGAPGILGMEPDRQLIWRYDGRVWTIDRNEAEPILKSVSMASSDLGWAVGRGGCIYAFDGEAWRFLDATLPLGYILSVSLSSVQRVPRSDRAIAVGDGAQVVALDHDSVARIHPQNHWRAVASIPETGSTLVVGSQQDQGAAQYEANGKWLPAPALPASPPPLYDVMAERGRVWVAGGSEYSEEPAMLYEYAAARWHSHMSPAAGALLKIESDQTDSILLLGRRSTTTTTTSYVSRYAAGQWQTVGEWSDSVVVDMAATHGGGIWVVGKSTEGNRPVARRFDGTAWTDVAPPATALFAVDANADHGVWIAARDSSGPIILLGDESGWDVVHRIDAEPLTIIRQLTAVSEDDLWVVGNQGLALHYDGQEWEQLGPAPGLRLDALDLAYTGVAILPQDQGAFIVGSHDTILRLERADPPEPPPHRAVLPLAYR